MLRIGVCVSGGGTNLQAVIDKIESGEVINAEIAVVVSNNPGAYALKRAEKHGIPAVCVSPKSFESREAFNTDSNNGEKEKPESALSYIAGGLGGLALVALLSLIHI